VVTGPARLVVVAPHPDDEVLAAGGLMRWSAAQGHDVVLVAVTDGESSHQRSTAITPAALRARRAREREEALRRLGIAGLDVHRLGAPDVACSAAVDRIVAGVRAAIRPGDAVVVPSPHDRHPDHVAVAAAARQAAEGVVTAVWEAPTWALVHGCADPPTSVLDLDEEAWRAKQEAMQAYGSQLVALGPSPDDGPVVHPHELARMLTRREQFRRVCLA
jgi:LmbE family N-acetylglucosaminyl deacetylase